MFTPDDNFWETMKSKWNFEQSKSDTERAKLRRASFISAAKSVQYAAQNPEDKEAAEIAAKNVATASSLEAL